VSTVKLSQAHAFLRPLNGLPATRSLRGAILVLAALGSFGSSGCLVLKAQHDDLAAKVSKLEQSADTRSQTLDEKLAEADRKLAELQGKLDQAETLLRGSQAGIGARMDTVESEVAELRGAAENAELVSSTSQQAQQELRAEVDTRLRTLEEKLNEATNIPEGKDELWAEAERQLQRKNYKLSRQLWRTVISRYPGDPKLPEANFKVGLTFFSERDYKSALGQFYRIIQEYADDPIVSDALYYSGLGFAKLGQCKNAIAYFEALIRPKSGASAQYQKAARDQIDILKKDTGDLCFDREDANAGAAAKRGVQESESKAPTSVAPAKPTTRPRR
jgi:TolA-binding protein